VAKLGTFAFEEGARLTTISSLELEGWVWEVGEGRAFDEQVGIVTSAAFDHPA
jgi:hypothetical protein